MEEVVNHYDEEYFRWQNSGAQIRNILEADKFRPFIPKHATVLDFGCGGGFLLKELMPDRAIGVEVNPFALECARLNGVEVVDNISKIPDLSVDSVVSNHAIEHVSCPLDILREMYRVLKYNGIAVIVVPCDAVSYPYSDGDRDMHLYSWSVGNMGNIARAAGFDVVGVSEYRHRFPPKWSVIYRLFGIGGLDMASRVWGLFYRRRSQVRLIASKKVTK